MKERSWQKPLREVFAGGLPKATDRERKGWMGRSEEMFRMQHVFKNLPNTIFRKIHFKIKLKIKNDTRRKGGEKWKMAGHYEETENTKKVKKTQNNKKTLGRW